MDEMSSGSEEKNWACLELDDGLRRIITFEKTECIDQSPPEIGQIARSTVNNSTVQGTLICSSGMGLTPVDVLNDILTAETDIENFLKQCNVKQYGHHLPGLIVQAYLILCTKLELDISDPIKYNNTEKNVTVTRSKTPAIREDVYSPIYDSDEEMCNIDDMEDEYMDFSISKDRIPKIYKKSILNSDDSDSDYDYDSDDDDEVNPKEKPEEPEAKLGTKLTKEQLEKMEKVKAFCDLCNAGNDSAQDDWGTGNYDKYLSRHMFDDHQIEDTFKKENTFKRELRKIRIPSPIIMNNVSKIVCEDCNTTFPKESRLFYRLHQHYHQQITEKQLDVAPNKFPCYACSYESDDYHEIRLHLNQHHPQFTYNCRDCNLIFTNRDKRHIHWLNKHKYAGNLFCEQCGKSFGTLQSLKDHLETHDDRNQVTCEVCGKQFASRVLYKRHRKIHTGRPSVSCPHCDAKFKYKGQLHAHEVREHGLPRRYACEICGAQFIHQNHLKRHKDKLHSDPTKPYKPRAPRTSNKTPFKHCDDAALGMPTLEHIPPINLPATVEEIIPSSSLTNNAHHVNRYNNTAYVQNMFGQG